jgi:hypothetical protein
MSSSTHMRFVAGGFVAAICWGAMAQDQPRTQVAPAPATQPAATQPTTGPAPQMELTPKEFDFGDVWQGAPAKRVFTIKNAGSAELTLSTKSSCGCTVATKPKSPLPPGESTTFEISYDTKGLGKAQNKVTVITNDPVQPNFDINVIGSVKPLVAMTPADRVKFNDLEPGSVATQTLQLENKFERPLVLKLKEGQDFGRFDVTLKELKPGMEYELTATTKPPLTKGWNHTQVALETGSEVLPTIIVPVQANVQPRILAFPEMLAVTPDMTQPTQKSVSVDYRKETPVEITGVKASLDTIKWERVPDEAVQPAGRRGSHRLLVTLPAFADLPADGATLEISTDDKDPQYQKLTVRILKVNQASPPRRVDPNSLQQVEPVPPGSLNNGGK